MLIEILSGVLLLLGIIYYTFSKNKSYWYDRNVPNTGFKFFFGDDKFFFTQKEAMHNWALRVYKEFDDVSFFGGWTMMGRPFLMIRNDFDLIKSIWIKDFDHFAMADSTVETSVSVWPATRLERIAIHNVQTATGDKWKDIRSAFSPIFTSGKLRNMTHLLQAINKKMNVYVSKLADSTTVFECKELAGKYSIDGIASCAFGVDSGSFDEDESEFLYHGKKVFSLDNLIFEFLVCIFTPTFLKKLTAKLGFTNLFRHPVANPHSKFLMEVVEQSFKQRKAAQFKRNDLIDMMIEAIDGTLDDDEEKLLHSKDQPTGGSGIEGNRSKKTLSYDDAISTALLMLSAGYETTGNTMAYILYELAMNQECQEVLYGEIMDSVDDVDDLTYETIQSLPYLDAVIHETMRKHPIVALLERVCTKEYKLPGHDIIIPKGGLVRTNNVGICYDPEIFPSPNEFRPERFLKENRGDRNPYTFMGFSLGPRNCLAMRFAMFEMKMCISSLVSNFRFLPCERTVKEVEWDPKSFIGAAKGGLWITCEKR